MSQSGDVIVGGGGVTIVAGLPLNGGGGGGGGGSTTLAGLTDVDVSGALNGFVLTYNGIFWTAQAASGGGSPGGTNRQVQFNNAGAFAGTAGATVDTNGKLTLRASSATTASVRVIPGAPPTVRVDGDVWVHETPGDFCVQAGGFTFGPMLARTPTRRVVIHEEFYNVTSTSIYDRQVAFSGGIGSVGTYGTDAAGTVTCITQSNAAATAAIITRFDQVRFGLNVEYTLWSRVLLPFLSNGTDRFIVRSGFINSIGSDGTNGVFFRYVDNANGGRWLCVCRSNNTETTVDSGVAATLDVWVWLRIKVIGDGGQAIFSINGTDVATITTNIPTGSGRECDVCPLQVQRTIGTAFRSTAIDTALLQIDWLTPRGTA